MGTLFEKFAQWLMDLLLFIPRQVFQWFTDVLAGAVEAIPVPDFMTSGGSMFMSIAPEVWFFASMGQFDVGVPMVVGAYVARFALRRIPFIGG